MKSKTPQWIAALTLLASGCGGELHLIRNKVALPLPPAKAHAPIHEEFRFAQTSGTTSVAFIIYPRRSTTEIVAQPLSDSLPAFYSALLAGARDPNAFRIGIFRELFSLDGLWTQGVDPAHGLPLLRDFASKLNSVNQDGVMSPTEPFELFSTLAQQEGLIADEDSGARWLHFVYFRADDAGHTEELKQEIRSGQKAFSSGISPAPLSPFRYSVHSVNYLDGGSPCQPLPSRVASGWRSAVTNQASFHELCAFGDSTLQELAGEILEQDRRLILRTPPNWESLAVQIQGKAVAHDDLIFDKIANEIQFTEALRGSLHSGDKIGVDYDLP
ncbi:MAG: hypothetical protein ACXWPM_03815 [Bdellovibrionota bacterium]